MSYKEERLEENSLSDLLDNKVPEKRKERLYRKTF